MGNEHSYTSTVEPRLTATSIIRSPRNYAQFFRSSNFKRAYCTEVKF